MILRFSTFGHDEVTSDLKNIGRVVSLPLLAVRADGDASVSLTFTINYYYYYYYLFKQSLQAGVASASTKGTIWQSVKKTIA